MPYNRRAPRLGFAVPYASAAAGIARYIAAVGRRRPLITDYFGPPRIRGMDAATNAAIDNALQAKVGPSFASVQRHPYLSAYPMGRTVYRRFQRSRRLLRRRRSHRRY